MPYTNCNACGAKALVGATRCPRCQAPFVSYDIKGERVETVNCPNCGVQRPVAIGVCPNCLMSTAPSGQRLRRGLTLTGMAIVAIMSVGYLISRRTERTRAVDVAAAGAVNTDDKADSVPLRDSGVVLSADTSGRASPGTAATEPAPMAAAVAAPATVPTASRNPPPAVATTTTPPTPAPPRPARSPTVAVPDTGRWEYALATTWVRVRSAPAPESEVLRMVDSAQRVQLGPPLNGWRSIRVGVDRGWVDPRYFTVVPAPRP